MGQTVLVTGGTGFVAGWCIIELLSRGYDVRTTVRSFRKEDLLRTAFANELADVSRLSFVIADLTRDDGWDDAVAGCDYVLHVASPLGHGNVNNPDDLIIPARDGALRVLKAATKAGVKRVVMTSGATAARPPFGSNAVADESMWTSTDERRFDPYRLSKILAERSAWEFMETHCATTSFVTILPGGIFGPVLTHDNLGSVQIIQRLITGKMPALPRLGLAIVDVRDLAKLHVDAMILPDAAGERFLATGEHLWLKEIAAILRSGLGEDGQKIPRRNMPDVLLRFFALLRPEFRMLAADLGRINHSNSDKARRLLGFEPRPASATLIDCANSLIAHGDA